MSEKITQAEYEVMNVLWEDAPLAASDVADRLSTKKQWSDRTVKTLLTRLAEKKAVAHTADGRRYLYHPLVSRQTYAGNATRSFVDRIFGGRAAPLVAQLAENGSLNSDDIAEIEALIEELKRDD